jgi:RNA polymerase sigma factor (sigma-70 family)
VATRGDEELMTEVRSGRTGALATLFERHHARVYRFCLRMTGDRQASEDLVQDVFMRMLKYRNSFDRAAPFEPWMFRIARNACADYWRSSARNARKLHEYELDVAATADSAHHAAATEEQSDLLQRALLALPAERREVLLLSRFESRKYDEIAAILDCSVGAVKVRVHRAIKELREIYFGLSREAHGEL